MFVFIIFLSPITKQLKPYVNDVLLLSGMNALVAYMQGAIDVIVPVADIIAYNHYRNINYYSNIGLS